MRHTHTFYLGCILTGLLLLPVTAAAQPAPVPFSTQPYTFDSGMQEGLAGEESATPAVTEQVTVSGAAWLRLEFGNVNLGEASYLLITSADDGAQQRLDAESLAQWRNTSAYFNGDSVTVELFVAPDEQGISFAIQNVMAGEPAGEGGADTEAICGGTDDRTAYNDPAVGRLVPVGCTAWIASNGAHLTAGHCVGASMQVLEFNVPASNADGTINYSSPEHQYAVLPLDDSQWHNDGNWAIGHDWAVFDVSPNSMTGLLPVQAQGAFYRMSQDSNPATIRITGYGLDNDPTGSTGSWNASSQTEQTHTGPSRGEVVEGTSDAYWRYHVDTMGGNSGGPIIIDGTDLTVGIHTNAGCSLSFDSNNIGTSFENNALAGALTSFSKTSAGQSVIFVDKDHPVTAKVGTVYRPYQEIVKGLWAASSGDVVSIVTGEYAETMTIDQAVTLTAPVGPVTIGRMP